MMVVRQIIHKIVRKLVHVYKRNEEILMQKKFTHFGTNARMRYPFVISHPELISVGKNTQIMSECRMQVYPELTGLKGKISIGENCFIGYRACILAGENITIGDDVIIGSNVSIFSYNHGINPEEQKPYGDQALLCKSIYIDNGCWIGQNAVILPGVKIGRKCVIGAGSIVTHDVPDFCKVAGNPAKIIGYYDFKLHKWVRNKE